MSDEFNKESDNMNDNKETKSRYNAPGDAPTEENPYYAYSYKKEPKEENYSSYRFTSQIPPEVTPKTKKKDSKKSGKGKKAVTLVASAAVFGLVAGCVFQGVNYVSDKFKQKETPVIEKASVLEEDEKEPKSVRASAATAGGVSEVAQNAMQSVVSITGISVQEIPNYFGFGVKQYETPSSGSGIIVGQNDEELLIATNNHVVAEANSLSVCFTNQDGTAANGFTETGEVTEDGEELQDKAVPAQVKGTDSDNDLAVIAVKLSDIPKDVVGKIKTATLGDSDSLIIGEQVVAIGNALGYGQSVTSGYVSALNKKVSSESADSRFIQTDAAINPGNSGGALLNMRGEVIGINSAKIADNTVEGMGFAIPISKAQPILDELMSKTTRARVEDANKAAYLGITCKNVTGEASQMYNMPVGVFVSSIEEKGPADEAGLQIGDIIRKIDGTRVESYENLVKQLQYYEAGEKIDFLISRADNGEYKEETITVKLGAKKKAKTAPEDYRSE